MSKLLIRNWAFINDKEASLNGETKLSLSSEDKAEQKLESLYRSLNVSYPKFFKMDAQSKLGWLCAEFVSESGKVFESVAKQDIALVLSNQKSSLDTDELYEQSLHNTEEFLPSPAVFVYTLSNIVTGEICIRHGLKGENNFFISERFDASSLFHYVSILFKEELCKQCLVGWVEAYKGSLKTMFVLVEKGEGNELFTIEKLNHLYQKSEL